MTPPIEPYLHVVAVISNPCAWRRRYQLAREFMERMEKTSYVKLYMVELAYGNQEFQVTSKDNPRHLQLRAQIPLWHKENMINLAVQKLLPQNWRAFAWIDADIQFMNPNWALEALRLLSKNHVVQLFTTITLLDDKNKKGSEFTSRLSPSGSRNGHTGFAWAMTRSFYHDLRGLFEYCIVGGADTLLFPRFTNKTEYWITNTLPDLNKLCEKYGKNIRYIVKASYISGNAIHHYHGDIKNRQYLDRWKILTKYAYNPYTYISKNADGVLIPTAACPRGLLQEIMQYFWERNEDEDTFPGRPTETCPDYLQSWEGGRNAEAPLQCNDSQSLPEVSVPQCETKPDNESSVVPDSGEASADMPDSKNENATPEELEYAHDSEKEQTPSIA